MIDTKSFPFRASAVPITLYLIISLLCTQLPLANYLGYEFSALTAIVASFIAGFGAIQSVKQTYAQTTEGSNASPAFVIRTFKESLLLNLTLLVIPLAVMTTNALFVKNCSLIEGFGFFLLIPVVSLVFSSALGLFCAIHYRKSKTVFFLFFLASILYTLALGYFTPAIFSYNFFYGFFPGLTYDEILTIRLPLIWFRIVTLLIAAVLVWMAGLLLSYTNANDGLWNKGKTLARAMIRGRSLFVTGFVVLMLGGLWLFRGELGFESHRRFIQSKLGSSFSTDHFVIYYSRQSYDSTEIRWIAAEHEFRLKQISDALHLPYKRKIESYIYPSSNEKQRLIGAGNTNIAKPWSRQIHITKQSLDATLMHELVHVAAGQFGLPVIHASLSTGLVEGLAMAIDWSWGNRTPHQYAAAMKKFGINPDIRGLMSITGFAAQSSSVSYILAGSFCRYLIDTYGIRSMMLLYSDNEYDRWYLKSLAALIAEWQSFLDKIPVPEQDSDVVDVMFRRPPIFGKICARVVAARNAAARDMLTRKKYAAAETLFEKSYTETRSYESMSGLLSASVRLGHYRRAVSILDTIMNDPRPGQFLPLFLTIGDACWVTGNVQRAAQLYRSVAIANFSDAFTEAALLRGYALADSTRRNVFLKYFLSDVSDSLRITMIDSLFQGKRNWLSDYLCGKLSQRLNRHEVASNYLEPLRLESVDRILEGERLRMLGYSLFRLQKYDQAKSAFWQSLNFIATDAAKYDVDVWVERCEWMEKDKMVPR